MSVIFSNNIALNTQPGDIANRPRILVDNVFQQGTVTASSENGADNGWLENAIDGLTFDAWEWSSTPAWLSVTLTTAQPVDMCAIGLHTGLTFVFQYHDGTDWVDLHDAVTTTTTAVHAVIFSEVTASQFRIYISDAADENILGIVMLGKSIQLPKTFHGGHAPIVLNRTTQIVRNRTENGFDAGVYSLRTGAATSVSIDNIKPSWIRENLEDLNKKLEICPFIFAWRPSTYPNDVAYCWLNSPIKASNNGTRDYMSLNFDVQAFISGGIAAPIVERMFIGLRNSPYLALYQDNETEMTELSESGMTALTSEFTDLDAHPRGIVAAALYADGVRMYDYRSDTWTALESVDSGLQTNQRSVSLHPDNAKWLLVTTTSTGTFIAKLYQRVTKPDLTNRYYLKTTGTIASNIAKFSPDGTLIATGRNTFLKIYTFNSAIGGVSASSTDYTVGQFVRAIAWSPSGEYIAVTCDFDSPRLKIFKRNMSTNALTELTIDTYWPKSVTARTGDSGTSNNIAWHPSEEFLAIGSDDAELGNVYIYQNNGDDTFSDVTGTVVDEQPQIGGRIFSIQWSTTGNRLYTGHSSLSNAPNFCAYAFNGTTLTKQFTQLVGDTGGDIGDMQYVRFVGVPTIIQPSVTASIFLYDGSYNLITQVMAAGEYTINPTITITPSHADFSDIIDSVSFYVNDVLLSTVSAAPFETQYEFLVADDNTTKTIRAQITDSYNNVINAERDYLFSILSFAAFAWDPTKVGAGITLSGGDLTATHSAATNRSVISARTRTTGKYYFCVDFATQWFGIGFANYSTFNADTFLGNTNNGVSWDNDGNLYLNSTTLASGMPNYQNSIAFAGIDLDAQIVYFYEFDGTIISYGEVNYSGVANMAGQALAPAMKLFGSGSNATLINGTVNSYISVPQFFADNGFKPWDVDDL